MLKTFFLYHLASCVAYEKLCIILICILLLSLEAFMIIGIIKSHNKYLSIFLQNHVYTYGLQFVSFLFACMLFFLLSPFLSHPFAFPLSSPFHPSPTLPSLLLFCCLVPPSFRPFPPSLSFTLKMQSFTSPMKEKPKVQNRYLPVFRIISYFPKSYENH